MNETKGNTAQKGVANQRTVPREGQKLEFLGREVCITKLAMQSIDQSDAATSVERHLRYWDAVKGEVWQPGEYLTYTGCGLLFKSRDRNGTNYWIITETDLSLTTILLPEEY